MERKIRRQALHLSSQKRPPLIRIRCRSAKSQWWFDLNFAIWALWTRNKSLRMRENVATIRAATSLSTATRRYSFRKSAWLSISCSFFTRSRRANTSGPPKFARKMRLQGARHNNSAYVWPRKPSQDIAGKPSMPKCRWLETKSPLLSCFAPWTSSETSKYKIWSSMIAQIQTWLTFWEPRLKRPKL